MEGSEQQPRARPRGRGRPRPAVPELRRAVAAPHEPPGPLPLRLLPAPLRADLGVPQLRRALDDRAHVQHRDPQVQQLRGLHAPRSLSGAYAGAAGVLARSCAEHISLAASLARLAYGPLTVSTGGRVLARSCAEHISLAASLARLAYGPLTVSTGGRRPRSLVCRAHFARCVLARGLRPLAVRPEALASTPALPLASPPCPVSRQRASCSREVQVAPSILSADFGRLREQVAEVLAAGRARDPRRRDGRPFRAADHRRAERGRGARGRRSTTPAGWSRRT